MQLQNVATSGLVCVACKPKCSSCKSHSRRAPHCAQCGQNVNLVSRVRRAPCFFSLPEKFPFWTSSRLLFYHHEVNSLVYCDIEDSLQELFLHFTETVFATESRWRELPSLTVTRSSILKSAAVFSWWGNFSYIRRHLTSVIFFFIPFDCLVHFQGF